MAQPGVDQSTSIKAGPPLALLLLGALALGSRMATLAERDERSPRPRTDAVSAAGEHV